MTAPPPPPDSRDPGVDVTAAPRYRIVTDGLVFKAQRRGWFLWRDISDGYSPTLAAATIVLGRQQRIDEMRRDGWRVVETRR